MEKENRTKKQLEILEEILQSVDASQKRLIECTLEKGASSWLTCLPLKSEDYNLNKLEFKDSIKLRYGWQLEGFSRHVHVVNPFLYPMHQAAN